DLAEKLNITLIGFVRGNRMSIYTHPKRVKL
ncbi:MAG: formate dehydrogenase accessory sulfurtransferase FdhD, partial [Peptostreptococcaceae bacterium]